MDILSVVHIDPQQWPFAAMVFLRIITIFFFLPIFGDQVVPMRLRIALGLVFAFFVYPVVSDYVTSGLPITVWEPMAFFLATLKETLFAFSIGFTARMAFFAMSLASHVVGINMGFQTATMFNPAISEKESSYAVFQNWILLLVFLGLNIHHVFIEELVKSFASVPIGPTLAGEQFSRVGALVIKESFILGIKLAGPLIAVQVLVNVSLGLLNRFLPALNIFVVSFPVSFFVTIGILLLTVTSLVSLIGHDVMRSEVSWLQTMNRVFAAPKPTPSPLG